MKCLDLLKSVLGVSSFLFCNSVLALDFRLEGGSVQTVSNFFQIPRTTGTRVDIDENKSQIYFRLDTSHVFSARHRVRALFAPLEFNYDIKPTSSVIFQNRSFSANTTTKVSYKFNSYRLGYSYLFIDSAWKPFIGFTAKVRDAHIELAQGSLISRKGNVGLVPLLNFGFEKEIFSDLRLILDIEGAAASQGRAIDGSLEVAGSFVGSSILGFGFRVLDGGANNKDVKNFAQFRFLFASLRF